MGKRPKKIRNRLVPVRKTFWVPRYSQKKNLEYRWVPTFIFQKSQIEIPLNEKCWLFTCSYSSCIHKIWTGAHFHKLTTIFAPRNLKMCCYLSHLLLKRLSAERREAKNSATRPRYACTTKHISQPISCEHFYNDNFYKIQRR